MERPEINIRHYLIMALGGTSFIHKYIDELYELRKWEYYEAFRTSEFYGDLRLSRHVARSEEKMKKVAGIVEWCYNRNEFDLVYKLIKKGFKFTYQYFTQRQHKTFNLDDFTLAYSNKKKEPVSDLELYYASIVLIYLCTKERKPYSLNNGYGELLVHALQSYMFECFAWDIRFSDNMKEQHKEGVEELFKHYGLPRNMKPTTLGKFLELFVEREVELELRKNPFQSVHDARGKIFQKGISKYIGTLSNWIKVNGLYEMDLVENIPITKQEVEAFFLDFVIAKSKEGNMLTDQDRDLYLVSTMYLYAVIKQLKEVKHLYLDDSQEQHYIELKQKEESIRQKGAKLAALEAEYKAKEEKMSKRIRELDEELRKANRALQQADAELEKREDLAKEVSALRSYVYSMTQDEESPQKLTMKELAEKIQQKKVAVIGGHQNWVNHMQEALPEVRFAGVDSLNRDISYVDNMDIVFVYTGILKHKYYRNLMNRMNSNKARLCYISNVTNVELTLKEMAQSMEMERSL